MLHIANSYCSVHAFARPSESMKNAVYFVCKICDGAAQDMVSKWKWKIFNKEVEIYNYAIQIICASEIIQNHNIAYFKAELKKITSTLSV